MVRQRAALDLALQALQDATVRAATVGTIIEKDVQVGQIIQSSTSSVNGGTTLLKMADLSHVRMRAYFNETDIGNIRAGEAATVTVDTFPDRRFEGKVEKIEPQAVVQQGVTMFSVLVNLENFDGALLPGMNGEVSAIVDQRNNVVAVSNDAIKTTREGVSVAPMLGLNPDSVQAHIRAQMSGGTMAVGGGRRGGRRGGGRGSAGTAADSMNATAPRGNVPLDPQQGAQQGGDRRGGGPSAGAVAATAPGIAVRPRTGLVFVADSGGYRARVVMLGQSNFDYTEVLSGLKDGEKVVMLNVLALQAARDQQQDRFRQMQSSPLGGGSPGGGGRGR